ncbi:toll/interleukin-1 receptor domain-containing protein [Massilia sp. GCM10023247]|uniref:toll/interleukin-1 receptor domain-containing protein n=1 Tax=Massilia sp. GCM10023247 TaxID=3252643 RepID=UPI00361D3244
MNKSIFISHATKDKELVSALVEFLENGMGVPEAEIFCSSLDGYGIPTGENFLDFIKSQIQEPKVVILLLTPSYFKSNFCLCEMGAAWAKSHKKFPILVPPLTYADVKDVLASTQAAKIDDDIKYNELRDYLQNVVELVRTTNTKWDTKRRAFLKKLPALLEKLSVPKEVTASEYAELKQRFGEAEAALLEYDAENTKLKEYVKKLENVKDREEVKKIKVESADNGRIERTEELLEEISAMRQNLGGAEVLKFILCDYYQKPYQINHREFGEAFAQAVRYNLLTTDDGDRPNWDNAKLKKLRKYLDKLSRLVETDDEGELHEYFRNEYNAELEPDNQEFWEFHYAI